MHTPAPLDDSQTFLEGFDSLSWEGHTVVFRRNASKPFVVLVAKGNPTTKQAMEKLHKKRLTGNIPLVIISVQGERCHLLGPGFFQDGMKWYRDVSLPLAEQALRQALSADDNERGARYFLQTLAKYLQSPVPGFLNEGWWVRVLPGYPL